MSKFKKKLDDSVHKNSFNLKNEFNIIIGGEKFGLLHKYVYEEIPSGVVRSPLSPHGVNHLSSLILHHIQVIPYRYVLLTYKTFSIFFTKT